MRFGSQVYTPPPVYNSVTIPEESSLLYPPSTFTLNGVTAQAMTFGYLQPKIDYSMGYAMKITQITENPPFTATDLGHGYHTEQFWNADQSLMKIGNTTKLNGQTYARIGTFPSLPSGGVTMWSKTRPEILYCVGVGNSKVQEYNVNTNSVVRTVVDLTAQGYTDMTLGNGTGIISDGDEYLIAIGFKSDGTEDYICVNLQAGTVRARVNSTDVGCLFGSDWITVSKLAGYIIASPYLNSSLAGGANKRVYDLDFNFLRSLTPYTHSNPGLDPSGAEVLYSMNSRSTKLSTGVTTNLLDWASTEIDLDNSDNGHSTGIFAGWSLQSVTTAGSATQEIFFVKGDGSGEIRRFCHTRRGYSAYETEPHATCNQTGTKVLFTSNNGASTSGQQRAFICEVATAQDIATYG